MIRKFAQIIGFTGCVLLVSCKQNGCQNANPIFDANKPESEVYKAELAKELTKTEAKQLTYFLNKYEDNDSLEAIYVDIKGLNLCATAVVLVRKQDDKLDGIKKDGGKGYIGAELKGLQFETVHDSLKTEFVYENLDGVVD